jgi:hypothetical protein
MIDLQSLSRKELQTLAKEKGVKANGKVCWHNLDAEL